MRNSPDVAQRTDSERVFEELCAAKKIPATRILETSNKTPDYEITVGSCVIGVEVKEIEPSAEELESERLLEDRGYGLALGGTPGAKVRSKIAASAAQMQICAARGIPALLVLYDRGRHFDHLDPYHIRTGMYGLEQLILSVPQDMSISPTCLGYNSRGPKWKMSASDNTSISAVGVLFFPERDRPDMHVFHNHFAANPLPISCLEPYAFIQYVLQEPKVERGRCEWKALERSIEGG